MGPVERTVTALAHQVGAACQVVVICGRNKRLVQRLQARQYPEDMKVVVTGGLEALVGQQACNLNIGSLQLAGCLFMQQRESLRRLGQPLLLASAAAGMLPGQGACPQMVVCRSMGFKHAGQAVPGSRPARSLHLSAPEQAASCITSLSSSAYVVADRGCFWVHW